MAAKNKTRTAKKQTPPPLPLEGVRVLDLTERLPGPAATLMLANFGAEVIKVEDPAFGDSTRYAPPLLHDTGAVFTLLHRGKKSVAVDIKSRKGKAAFLKLVSTADVLVEGMRPGDMKKLGLDYEKLSSLNKGLVYTSITGYGQDGPYAKLSSQDINYLSLSGALELIGNPDGPPLIPGIQIGDLAGGALPAVIGILLALRAREKTKVGQLVDVSMLDGVIGLLAAPLANYTVSRRAPLRGKERVFGRFACYNVYAARNGRWISVGALEPKHWATLCKEVERPDLIEDQYAEGDRQRVVIAELTRIFQRKEAHEWFEIFRGKDACVTIVNSISDVVLDAHLQSRGSIVSVEHPQGGSYDQLGVYPKLGLTPGRLGPHAPGLGEHTKAVLRSAGVPVKEVDRLLKATQTGAEEDEPEEPEE
jgi:crotonobetainyl-CoA:carnitine CoA-transferase CaiB-like acyl-CoA transferase